MSGRNRVPPLSLKGIPHSDLHPPPHEPLLRRGLGPVPHPAVLEEMRESQFLMGRRPLPPHPAILEEHLAAQNQEIQGLLHDNQGLAATHVALRIEVEASMHKLLNMEHYLKSLHSEKESQIREMNERSSKLEMDLQAVDTMKVELMRVCADIKELTDVKQDHMGRVQALNLDLARASGDLQQIPALKAEINHMKQELQQARAAIEYEKKGYAENYEHGQVMEKKLVAMAREVEKLRAEMANAGKRAHAAATVVNPGYSVNHANLDSGYAGNPYPAAYGMDPNAGVDNYSHHGRGPGGWAPYDAQRTANR